ASGNSKRRLARKPRGPLVCWPSNDGALLEVHVIRPFALMSLLGLALSAGADEATPAKPPLTKEQERERFHPHREGMAPAPRLASYERGLQMEKDALLKGLRFRAGGPEVQGARIVDIEGPAAHPDSYIVA